MSHSLNGLSCVENNFRIVIFFFSSHTTAMDNAKCLVYIPLTL